MLHIPGVRLSPQVNVKLKTKMAASDERTMSSEAILLQEFVETFKLPKISEVVGGHGLNGAPFSAGDSLVLRTLAVESVGLRFYDADAGSKREVRVPVDNSFKFHVVQDYNSTEPKVYKTVADLLTDCPTFFRANTEVITKKGNALQSGCVLNFIRKTRSLNDMCLCLECKDSAGTHHLLPLSSQGNFSIVHDPLSYTLQEIISLGAVERVLRLSNENKKFAVANDGSQQIGDEFTRHLPVYDNVQNKDAALSRITGLPLTFKGIIYMQRPDLFLLASPADDTDVRWKIALDSNLFFKIPEEEKSVEYGEPIKPELVLKEFVEEFEQDFPVVAQVGYCDQLHEKFKGYLSAGMEILVHRIDKIEKMLCSISGDKFLVSDRVKGRLRKSLRRFKSLSELVSIDLKKEVSIKMMEDIASDVPEHFSLKAGDVLVFKNFNVSTLNVKLGKKSYEKCHVIQCEKVLEDETRQKLQLPLDLEADFIQLPNPGEESGFDINVVLSKSVNVPLTVDFIPTSNTETCLLPTDCEIEIENIVTDSVLVLSPLPHREDRRESGISARLKFCLLLPLRSDISLRLEDKLQFPSNYFIFPRRHKWIEEEVECLSEGEYGYLTKYSDSAYEDYAFRQTLSECNIHDYSEVQS